MTAEAGPSGSKNTTHNRHFPFQRSKMFYTADVTSSSTHNQRRDLHETEDGDNDNVDKIISVDEFNDSDDEDIHSCSTESPTPSDQSFKDSFSRHYSPGDNAGRNSQKLRKKAGLVSKVLDEQELQNLRLKINSRERKRMHDLNSALDGLREVMPYAHGPSVRKLSKIATLLLARNYILMLNSSLEEMKKLVSDIYHSPGATRRLNSQMTQRASVSSSVVTCGGNGTETNTCSDSSATGLHSQSTTPPSKASETFTAFVHPSTSHISTHSAHQPAPSILPLSIPALRASFSGLAPPEINALSCDLTKCEGGSDQAISHTFPEHIHLLHRLQLPCSCVHCQPGATYFPPGLQLSRFSHPLFLSTAFLNRKN